MNFLIIKNLISDQIQEEMDPSKLTPEQMKQQAAQINGLSDDQLKNAASQAGAFNPMMANMDPSMLRQASQMMQNMSPDQLANMQKMAANMMGGNAPPNMPQQPVQNTQTPQAQQPITAAQKELRNAETLKSEAGVLVQQKKFDLACQKYFSAINLCRMNDQLKSTKGAIELEMACRSNIALCKLNLGEYDHVVDQAEKVLEHDPKNIKCAFRMAQALWQIKGSETQIKTAFKWIKVAHLAQPSDSKITELYNQIRATVDSSSDQDTQSQAKQSQEPISAETTQQKLLSRIKIEDEKAAEPEESKDEPLIEEVKTASQPQMNQQQFVPPSAGPIPTNPMAQEHIEKINSMDDSQLSGMLNMCKANPEMLRQQCETFYGRKFSEQEFSAMMGNLNVDQMKAAAQMAKNNPEIVQQHQKMQGSYRPPPTVPNSEAPQNTQNQTQTNPNQQTAPFMGQNGQMPSDMQGMKDMMNSPMVQEMLKNPETMKMMQQMMGGGQGGEGLQDPSKMEELMKNPSVSKLLENPEYLSLLIGNLKNPAARPMLEDFAKKGNVSPETIIRGLEWLTRMAHGYKRVAPALPLLKWSFIILAVAYVLKWTGVTGGLFFMMPFQ